MSKKSLKKRKNPSQRFEPKSFKPWFTRPPSQIGLSYKIFLASWPLNREYFVRQHKKLFEPTPPRKSEEGARVSDDPSSFRGDLFRNKSCWCVALTNRSRLQAKVPFFLKMLTNVSFLQICFKWSLEWGAGFPNRKLLSTEVVA